MENLTEVCNAALSSIGETTVEQWDGTGTSTHDVLKAHLKPTIREVQTLLPWSELETDAELLADGGSGADGATFTLPADCLRVLRVCDAERELLYTERGGKFHVDSPFPPERVQVVFLRHSENPQEWGALLTTAVVKLLAARIYPGVAHDLSGTVGLEKEFYGTYLASISDAAQSSLKVRGANQGVSLDGVVDSALRAVGAPAIADWRGDASMMGRALRGVLLPTVKEVQSLTRWTELIHCDRLQWTGREGTRDGRHVYCYYRPERCLRVLAVSSDKKWFEEGSRIWSASEPDGHVEALYVRYSENPAEWSSELFGLVVKLVAARITATGLGDLATAQKLEEQFWTRERPRVVTQVLNRQRGMSKTLKTAGA